MIDPINPTISDYKRVTFTFGSNNFVESHMQSQIQSCIGVMPIEEEGLDIMRYFGAHLLAL